MPDPVTIPQGDIAFYDNYIPSLEAGEHTIFVQSGITGVDTADYFSNPLTQSFEVRAPQFTLSATEVHAAYPPSNSTGIYDQVLPHIVLETPALPWERFMDASDNTIPWMALLVLAENEITIDPVTHSSVVNIQVSDYLTPSADVLRPALNAAPYNVPADLLTTTCQTITISANLFNAVVPLRNDLKYLSHVRQINTVSQAATGMDDIGWYSVIVGNRLLNSAQDNTTYYVHLVSLEGFLPYVNSTPIPNKGSNPAQQQDVQLVSLYNWSLTSQAETGTGFADLAENFVTQAKGNSANLLLSKPFVPPANPGATMQQVTTRLSNGYVAMSWQTQTNENTFAWYRGPFSPVIAPPLPRLADAPHYTSAAAAMIYDSVSGVFDHSYSAAWNIGRALALSDGTFGPSMLSWRKKTYRMLGMLLDNLAGQQITSDTDLSAIVAGNAVRNSFDQMLAGNTSEQFTNFIHQPVKVAANQLNAPVAVTAPDPVALAQQYLATPSVQALIQEAVADELQTIVQWIAKKQLLYDIPFNHLVPDPEMLPQESLRMFYVDQNWLDVLTDGALSVGIQGSKDAFITQAMRGVIDDGIKAQIQTIRSTITGTSTGDVEADSTQEAMSGLLIRSAMISGWPGLEITGTAGGKALKILRMDRLSPDVLLVIFLDVPDTITLAEPPQGLVFGVEDSLNGSGNTIILRYINGTVGAPIAGSVFPATGGFQNYFRAAVGGVGGNVLNICSGTTNIISDMTAAYPQAPQTLTPSEFAIQMVKAPEQLTFSPATMILDETEPGPVEKEEVHQETSPDDSPKIKPASPEPSLSFFELFFQWLGKIWKRILSFFGIK